MNRFQQSTLIKVLKEFRDQGRGLGGQYEQVHKNVPAGVMVAVTGLEELDLSDLEDLKQKLVKLDMYPTGYSGDFSKTSLKEVTKWFFDRSVVDNKAQPQQPIAHMRSLTRQGLGDAAYEELVGYLADNMNVFKVPHTNGTLVPADRENREMIVKGILDGLSKVVRYTRQDGASTGFQFTEQLLVEKPAGTLDFFLTSNPKMIVLREDEENLTSLDVAMVGSKGDTEGKTYITADGEPLADRGSISLSEIWLCASQLG